ncbi:CD151 antigen-like [Watersipora subatra]|uniref:CD151 antigen-like n=1 Tax=Watersipora subatra TaxID=2589382 RepID=UPI00355B9932
MGFCRVICTVLLIFWSCVSMLYALALMGFMAFKIVDHNSAESKPEAFFDLLRELKGEGLYEQLNIVQLNKYTWYACLGLGALVFIAAIIHMISASRKSRCLLGLGTLLMILALLGDAAGLAFRMEAVKSINSTVEVSLNQSIVERYGHPDFDNITDAWNLFGEKVDCCGIFSGKDFEAAKNWQGEIVASIPPCGKKINTGCGKTIHSTYVTLDDIWLAVVMGVKMLILLITLMHTICVCNFGFRSKSNYPTESGSYTPVEMR